VVTILAGLVGLVVATYAMNPNLAPQTTRAITISDVSVDRDVSLTEYMQRMPVRRAP
jgi:hypothetical protein